MIQLLFKYLCSLIILLFALIPFILVLPIYVFRFLVGSVIIRCYPAVDKLLTTGSSIYGVDRIYKEPGCTIVVTLVVEGTVNLEDARNVVQTRLLQQRDANGRFKKPEFQQYVSPFWGFLAWKWDYEFDVRNHIRMYGGRYQQEFANVSKRANSDTVLEVSDELVSSPFSPKRSPWVVHLIHNYHESDQVAFGTPGGPAQTAMILQAHHSLGDGFSLLKAFAYDLTVGEKVAPVMTSHSRSLISGLGKALHLLFSAPYELITETLMARDVNTWHVPEEQLERNINRATSNLIPMEYLKEVKGLQNVALTALILDCFTAAIRKFMIEAGFSVPDVIHCGAPFPAPGHPDKMRNHLTGCILTLPVGLSDPSKRFQAIEKNLKHVKRSSLPAAGFYLTPFTGALFRWMILRFVRNNLTTAVMSNFPGPQNAVSIIGHKLVTVSFSFGLYEGNVGMAFSAMSYNGTMRISAGIDNGIVPKHKLPATKLIQYFMEELGRLRVQGFV